MNPQQINELAAICTRYAELKNKAKEAQHNLVRFRMGVFSDMITGKEIEILKEAESIAERISMYTSQSDAVRYFNNIQKQTV